MKKMNRLFVKSLAFAGALTIAAVVGTGSAEASGHHGDRSGSHGMVQAKDEFHGNHQRNGAKERHEKPAYTPERPAKTERHDRYVKHDNHEKAEKGRNCHKVEKEKQPVQTPQPVKTEKPVEKPAAEKPVKAEKPMKDKSHSQGAEHASETAKLHANPNSAIFAGETEKEDPAEVVVETPAVEDENEATEVETPAVEDETKSEDSVNEDKDATHEEDGVKEDEDKEESSKGEKMKEMVTLLKQIRILLMENDTDNEKLYEAIHAAILAFQESLKEDDTANADTPAVPEDNDEVEVIVSDSSL